MSTNNQLSGQAQEDVNRIISEKFREISIFSYKGKVAGLEIRTNPEEQGDEDFFADNQEYIYALYKVLKRADDRGWFDNLKTEDVAEIKEYV